MKRCNATIKIGDKIVFQCHLEKDHKTKHRYEGICEGKLFIVEWWSELPKIEGLSEMYVRDEEI